MWEAEKRVQKMLYRLDCPSFRASDDEITQIFMAMGIQPKEYTYSTFDEVSNWSYFHDFQVRPRINTADLLGSFDDKTLKYHSTCSYSFDFHSLDYITKVSVHDESGNRTISSFELFQRDPLRIEPGQVLTFETLTKQLNEIGVETIDDSIITSRTKMSEGTRETLKNIYDERGTVHEPDLNPQGVGT